MKKILQLMSLSLLAICQVKAQTVYFSQNFNSSTNYTTYVGTGKNQFDGLVFNGNAKINTLNNKLQIVKSGGTGVNRAGVTKTTTPFNTNLGGFLKFEMDVLLTNNTPNVNIQGFMFSIGKITGGTAPFNPPNGEIHSVLYLNPTATTGSFVLEGRSTSGLYSSEPLSGAQKLVWYINNTGNPAGYTAPDGSLATILDDAADVWAIGENGVAKLVIDEIPALNPAIDKLMNFKISNDLNFVATLDIDNIVISEEPVVILKKISKIAPPKPVNVPLKTMFNFIPLPTMVDVTLEDGTTDKVAVKWTEIGQYNPYKLGEYELKGDITPNRGTINFDKLSTKITVAVRNNLKIVNTFSPNGDGVNDTWIIPDLQHYKNVAVEVFDRDGKQLFRSTDPKVGWDGKNKQGQVVAGSYFYIIKVPDLIMEEKGVLTVLR